MKKFISGALAVIITSVMSMGVFAATPVATWDPDPANTRDQSATPETIPMYGYIGPFVENPEDPDPEDPTVNPWKLNMSVPVKFIWAAFEPTSGLVSDVDSPTYNIINRSKRDIKVSVLNFIETVDPIDTSLGDLNLFFKESSGIPIFNKKLFDTVAPVTFGTAIELGIIDKSVLAMTGSGIDTKWAFKITGQYTADTEWPDEIQLPEYNVVFGFKIDR